MASGDDVAELAEQLAGRLREAHDRVAALEADPVVRARAMRRLIAITNAAKHHLPIAARRLDAFLADLDAGRYV